MIRGGRGRDQGRARLGILASCLLLSAFRVLPSASAPAATPAAADAPHRGLTAGGVVAAAYDTVLDADFDAVPALLSRTCGPAPDVACLGLRALATWWEIQLDPQSRFLDARFLREANAAIEAAAAWTTEEPQRAETWFYLGAALGVRGQWRVLRNERLAAARDGKRIKTALERALALDPGMHDAEFGIGAYRYYAAVAPSYLRWLRWLFLLPGGNRAEGLAQMEQASRLGILVGGEARYQLHVIYLWYERRAPDALALVRDLAARYPHNPLFRQIEAEILDVYFHDAAASLAASEAIVADARRGALHRSSLAEVRARLNIAVQQDRLGRRDTARAGLDRLLATNPSAPLDAVTRARSLQRAWRDR